MNDITERRGHQWEIENDIISRSSSVSQDIGCSVSVYSITCCMYTFFSPVFILKHTESQCPCARASEGMAKKLLIWYMSINPFIHMVHSYMYGLWPSIESIDRFFYRLF